MRPVVTSILKAVCLSTILLSAMVSAADIVSPEKSPIDDKDYRGFVLDNGMKVMLVSDPNSDQAAAALDVHVGSGSDPEGWNGLAHFLEHMLFLGNGKYPEAGEYQKFIQSRGGSNNAYTAYDHTNYFFSVNYDSLEPALDRFSRFFIDPSFDETFVNRERSVVHSEYQARLKDEARRIWSAQKRILNPGHPGSRFSVGSEHTLRDRDGVSVRDRLIAFYQRWYSADIMSLAVVGREPLDELETMVRQMFSEAPNRDTKPPLYIQSYLNKELQPVRLDVVPEKDVYSVSFTFAIPGVKTEYDSKPVSYIANILGHEGGGSLLAFLKQRGWADSLSAGAGFMDKKQGTLQVSIGLTEPGVDYIAEIGEMLFYKIHLLASSGVEQWRFDEEASLGNIAFNFAEQPGAGSLAQSLAARMQDYPLQDVLIGPYMRTRFDPDRISQILSLLKPELVYLQVVSPDHKVRKRTRWYDVRYGISSLEPALVSRWQNAANLKLTSISLPEENAFIPGRLSLQSLASMQEKPARLENSSDIDAWHQSDQTFGAPRSRFYFSVKSPATNSTASQSVHTELLAMMLNDQLNATTYPARLAGLNYDLYRHSRGVSVKISGYQDRQEELLQVVLDAITNPVITEEALSLKTDELSRNLQNKQLDRPLSQTIQEVYRLLMYPYWTEAEQLEALASVTVESMQAHVKQLFAKVSLTALAHGDISAGQSEAMVEKVANAFTQAEQIADVDRIRLRRLGYRLPYLRTMDIDHGDSAITIYLQGEEKSLAERARASLLGQLIEAPFYFDLRTTHRTGYLVFAGAMNIRDVPGLIMSVQSPTHTVSEINSLIDDFIATFPAQLAEMTEQEYARAREGLVAQILIRDTRLSSRTNRYWSEIDDQEYGFDSKEKLAEMISRLTKTDIQNYLNNLVKLKPRRLIVQSAGRREGAADQVIIPDGNQTTGLPPTFHQTAESYFPAL